jgi:hypothetical protein
VSQAGRQRVLKQCVKNVHASMIGEVEAIWGAELRDGLDNDTLAHLGIGKPFTLMEGAGVPVEYNPYKYECFVRVTDKTRVSRAARVRLGDCKAFAAGIE